MVRVFSRLTDPVLRPTVRALHGWALAAMISNAVVIATGAAVRLSSSGLGCPDWPACTKSSAVAADSSGQTLLNSWIEFGNRLLNFPLVAIAGLTFIAFFMWHRQQKAAGAAGRIDLVWLSAVLPLGVCAQAVIGGIVVLTKLNPALVVGALPALDGDHLDVRRGPARPDGRAGEGVAGRGRGPAGRGAGRRPAAPRGSGLTCGCWPGC